MDFKKLLEYQTIDQELIAIQREFRGEEESKQYVYFSKVVRDAQDQMAKLNTVGRDIMAEYSKLAEDIEAMKKDLKDYEGISEGAKEVSELDYYIKNIEQLMDNIQQLEKKTCALKKKIEETNSLYVKIWKQGINANEKKHEVSPQYKAKAAEYKPRIDEKQAKLQELAKEIEPRLIEAYNSLKQANKLPAFVEYDPNTGQCGRCFMELANDAKAKLKKPGDFVECPNCRRILFIPEE